MFDTPMQFFQHNFRVHIEGVVLPEKKETEMKELKKEVVHSKRVEKKWVDRPNRVVSFSQVLQSFRLFVTFSSHFYLLSEETRLAF